ncbi:hypothetical protein QTI33_25660 [Variovorax sp. J22P271]|uniref:hypothetical protein n=1 Tax=Variovorax davisae TaxID=3053515 RepID=UPI0025756CD7|nr:hypothetical protein [Variovorax sp. J22P271]MDM0035545.1 hypothetical protein [Variovorax sp. J22P271]
MADSMGALGVPAIVRPWAVKAVRRTVRAQLEAQDTGLRPIEQTLARYHQRMVQQYWPERDATPA